MLPEVRFQQPSLLSQVQSCSPLRNVELLQTDRMSKANGFPVRDHVHRHEAAARVTFDPLETDAVAYVGAQDPVQIAVVSQRVAAGVTSPHAMVVAEELGGGDAKQLEDRLLRHLVLRSLEVWRRIQAVDVLQVFHLVGMSPLVPESDIAAPEAGLHVVTRTHAPEDPENNQLHELSPGRQSACTRLFTTYARDFRNSTELHRSKITRALRVSRGAVHARTRASHTHARSGPELKCAAF